MQDRKQGKRSNRLKALFFCLTLTAAAAAIATIIVVWSTVAGLITLSAVLWLALLQLLRTARRERVHLGDRVDDMRVNYESIIAVLSGALDLQDSIAAEHSKRVSQLASVVAWQMGLRKHDVRLIEKAAILHDIGKVGIPEDLLSKPSELNDDDWAVMKRHPELGFQVLDRIEFLSDAADIVHAHHERFDGGGYPRGLKGADIPLGARIFAIVDAYVAMTSPRPYRKAIPHTKAVEEIVRNSGTQFDPEVVQAFIQAEKRGLLEPRRSGPDPDGHPAQAAVPSSA